MKRGLVVWMPLLVGLLLFGAFFVSLLRPADRNIGSKLVGQPLPQFATQPIVPGVPAVEAAGFADGKVHLLNVFASWCVPCRAEAPLLMTLRSRGIDIQGVAVHDSAADLRQFLAENGMPYSRLGDDPDGRAQMALGSTGVPETFLVDGRGRILRQFVGPITEEDLSAIYTLAGRP